MDISGLREKFGPVLKQYWISLALGLCGFVFLLYGLISSVIPQNSSGDILSEGDSGTAETQEVAAAKIKAPEITLDIEGAVMRPGIYDLPKDARVHDALIKAGGLSDKADREKVAKGLNLATKVVDGGKIYIPFIGDSAPVGPGNSASQVSAGSSGMVGEPSSGLVNINSATSDQLDTLPGVGPVTASKIINNRPYGSIDELLSKKAVGESVFEKIKEKVTAN